MESIVLCPVCIQQNKESKLKLYQINLTSAVYLCEDKSCPYPINRKWKMVERDYKVLTESREIEKLDVWLNKQIKKECISVTSNENSISVNTDTFLAELFNGFDNDIKHNINNTISGNQAFTSSTVSLGDPYNPYQNIIPEDITFEQFFNNLDAEVNDSNNSFSVSDNFLQEFNQNTNCGNLSSFGNNSTVASSCNILKSDIKLEKQSLDILDIQNSLGSNNIMLIHDTKLKQTPNVNCSIKDEIADVSTVPQYSGNDFKCNSPKYDKFKDFKFHSTIIKKAATM